ncbi:GGDEF domain-containing protein [Demequina sp. TMPB413]|uniref:GGDEF domain-containing protein n=1 Tax=unclassified Demequina TaxID=2620311 RepID=UPI001CF23A4E|nr:MULTISPECIES: GGDEF domain-containing protein [unclassified Demequina]UPU89309.1 GGDEF domain-containing protein [Demequina sp. TMPB413]
MGTAAYVVGEGTAPRIAAALGNGAAVAGAACVWLAARSLRGLPTPWRVPVGVGTAFGLISWWEYPQEAAWPGGLGLLVGMGAMLGLSARELIVAHRLGARREDNGVWGEALTAIAVLAVASVVATLFYGIRVVAYLTIGPDADFYVTWVGPRSTTFLILLLLVVVSYTVTALSHFEIEKGWRTKALTDDLTGMLNRGAFVDRAHATVGASRTAGAVPAVVVADIDHFKDINDRFGHAYGDHVLVAFASAVAATLSERDVAARFGGEEFVLLIADADNAAALALIGAINAAFEGAAQAGEHIPTVSYGVAVLTSDMTIDDGIQAADAAMYRAKREGRARAAVHDGRT